MIRSGVEPAELASPKGSISPAAKPSCSSRARRMATPRAPPTSRWALRPRRYTTGNTSSGANQRKASSGIVTPMPTPTSTSVGASTPSAIRATPTSATSPAATHLPVLRQRPLGTSVYRIATSTAAKVATSAAGIAQLPQLVRRSTPNGRGRRAVVATRTYAKAFTSGQATSHTSR